MESSAQITMAAGIYSLSLGGAGMAQTARFLKVTGSQSSQSVNSGLSHIERPYLKNVKSNGRRCPKPLLVSIAHMCSYACTHATHKYTHKNLRPPRNQEEKEN